MAQSGAVSTSTDLQPTTDDADSITGPHLGLDRNGTPDHTYYRCEDCGLESTDESLQNGCWRCND